MNSQSSNDQDAQGGDAGANPVYNEFAIYKHILPYLCWNGCTRIGEKTRLNVFIYGKYFRGNSECRKDALLLNNYVKCPSLIKGKYNGQVGEWLKPGDCKSPASGYVGSNPTLSTKILWSRRRRLNTWS